MFKKLSWLFLVAGLLTVGLVACGEADITDVNNSEESAEDANETSGDGVEEESTEDEQEAEEDQTLAIGDSIDFDGLIITLNEARIEEGGEFDEPENDQFVVVNLTAENTTDEEQAVSSIMNVELKDTEGYAYTTTILTEGIKGQFDGAIEAGGKLRGEIPFDVPTDSEYELHFSNPFKSGKAIWVVSGL